MQERDQSVHLNIALDVDLKVFAAGARREPDVKQAELVRIQILQVVLEVFEVQKSPTKIDGLNTSRQVCTSQEERTVSASGHQDMKKGQPGTRATSLTSQMRTGYNGAASSTYISVLIVLQKTSP